MPQIDSRNIISSENEENMFDDIQPFEDLDDLS